MKSFSQKALGWLITVILWIWVAFDKALNFVGKTTSPEDGKLFVESKLPEFLDWLFNTPWWVPPLIAAAFSVWFIWWVSWPSEKSEKPPATGERSRRSQLGLCFTGVKFDDHGAPQNWDNWLYIKNFGDDTRNDCIVRIETIDQGGMTTEIKLPLRAENQSDERFKLTAGDEIRLLLTRRRSPNPRDPQLHVLQVPSERPIRIDRGGSYLLLVSAHSDHGLEGQVLIRVLVGHGEDYMISAEIVAPDWV